MENYLNKDLMRGWTPEARDAYQKALQRAMAETAIYYSQLVEVRVEMGDYQNGTE